MPGINGYISIQEASCKWACRSAHRIIFRGGAHPWFDPLRALLAIPDDAEKPTDPRNNTEKRRRADLLRIAVCDDMDAELRRIVELVDEYLTTRSMCAELREFSHPDALLTACEKESYHIFLLDMVMPMVSGLELGREIRRISTDAQIIYITTEPGFALDAYAVNPLHYLIKPVDKGALFAVLDLAAEKVGYGKEATITVKTRDGLRTISTDKIALCKYSRHAVIYTLINKETVETTTIAGNFSEHIALLLQDRRFIQPHAAYAVNMNLVERLDKDGFTLKSGSFVPVSGKQYTAVRNAYMSYRLGGA